ncbi:hypothetical protein HFO56_00760 [Rhizobium laguerreae]|uniref:hypothetical protein n=1 Tax=Rhizobium laguerreae TaxID=1076926 RepID=UPI001C903DCE|nr:hypothetical protein [Rhizobium laguerreae]MBY3150960.1 hypothetical protein [Rhizobium laguerreae]
MLSIFIMLFVAIGVAAGIGYSVVTLINTAQTSLTIQANQVRLQNIATSVRAGLTTDGGNVLLPVLVDGGNVVARLPASSPFSTTTSGADIVFCPAFPSEASSGTVVNPLAGGGSESFGIDTITLAGKTYARNGHPDYSDGSVASRLADMGVIAYLLSPQPHYKGPLACGNVQLAPDNYTLLVDGGTVVPIYTITTDARGSVFVLSADGETPSGYNGTDRVVRTLGDVANFINQYQLSDITVRVPTELTVSLTDFQSFIAAGTSRTLRLVPGTDSNGNPAGHSRLVIDAGTASVESANYYVPVRGSLHVDGITFSGTGNSGGFDVALDAKASADVVLEDTTVAGLKTSGGRISTSGDTIVAPDKGDDTGNNPVYAQGGDILLRPSSNVTAVVAPGAVMVFRSNGGTINLPQYMKVSTSSTAALSAVQNGGRVVVPTDGSAEPTLSVSRDGVSVEEAVASARETAIQVCPDGDTSCAAVCPTGRVVITGGCSNSSGTPLISFGPDENNAYACEFSALPTLTEPKATAVCDFR